ncbi:MAG: hypothetical protein HOO67_06615 [Candidatus Peribacteraceae bacterium]|nr:hypothetical protein [Candidatus Peribacteraceae bacterium]
MQQLLTGIPQLRASENVQIQDNLSRLYDATLLHTRFHEIDALRQLLTKNFIGPQLAFLQGTILQPGARKIVAGANFLAEQNPQLATFAGVGGSLGAIGLAAYSIYSAARGGASWLGTIIRMGGASLLAPVAGILGMRGAAEWLRSRSRGTASLEQERAEQLTGEAAAKKLAQELLQNGSISFNDNRLLPANSANTPDILALSQFAPIQIGGQTLQLERDGQSFIFRMGERRYRLQGVGQIPILGEMTEDLGALLLRGRRTRIGEREFLRIDVNLTRSSNTALNAITGEHETYIEVNSLRDALTAGAANQNAAQIERRLAYYTGVRSFGQLGVLDSADPLPTDIARSGLPALRRREATVRYVPVVP